MTRSRATARQAGTRHASSVAAYLAGALDDDRIERRALTGSKDRGDITGLRLPNTPNRLVVECKEYGGRLEAGKWLGEAEQERLNDGALAGFVVAKRRGVADPAGQIVLMTLADLAAILTGERP